MVCVLLELSNELFLRSLDCLTFMINQLLFYFRLVRLHTYQAQPADQPITQTEL